MSKVCVFFADGFEEIEALTIVDILRRAEIEAEMVSVTGSYNVTGAHDITIAADILFEAADFEEAAMLVLPGGMPGSSTLDKHKELQALLKEFAAKPEKKVAAICAAPMVLGHLGILKDQAATIYPGMEAELVGAEAVTDSEVVISDNIITSRAPGTAMSFALALVSELLGQEKADALASDLVYQV